MEYISLEIINQKYAQELADILNTDQPLKIQLGSADGVISTEEFIQSTEVWQTKTNSKTLAIILNNKAIGLISLSHIDNSQKTARIGYWLCSQEWNKGYASKAFDLVLNLAKELNIDIVTAEIPKNNLASLAIWKKYNSTIEEDYGKYYPRIQLCKDER